ncbi:hypothetical protein TTHERM_00942710 (macronuclear) [Tetrahymena thermophila SB210]|uniref:Uncharacterized protein n=1 Tax=Tetrahymena thermophila (strain SB210) TaxID=312017 RepID=Q22DK8_TETTS|nr:hypothetical protein TTHERM_00942710 [Tetrahymena thermophila SB210]EAR83350.1 hypothetical protein TTHERM_00942710 [Tetrahymena thermophila SB210]|eukprot:XP_001031013.1 hypothetical protein TTHERM_00942710 [Tetrahymena thermophila SB210]
MDSLEESQFLEIYSQSTTYSSLPSDKSKAGYVTELSLFKEDLQMSTTSLFKGDQQEYIIIWGDPYVNEDNEHAKQGLISMYPFLKNRIYKFEKSKDFRQKSIEFARMNILFLMSGTFANEQLDGQSNIQWVNNNIRDQKLHSKSIILFTSMNTVRKNNWTIENLQQKYKYVTQLTVDYSFLFTSFDKMIFNRIHRSFIQNSHLDYYFRSKTKDILNIFQTPKSHSFKELQSSIKDLKNQFQQLCQYVKENEIQAPLTLYLSQVDLEQTVQYIEQCFTLNGASKNDDKIIENFIKLYTQETPVYKILNFSLNTMNMQVYNYLKDVFKILSKCIYSYNDNQNISEIKLVRGAAIQKYQYDTMYQEYSYNQKKNVPTFISFPQFLSTSNCEKVAKRTMGLRIIEVKVEQSGREQVLNQYSILNKEYLKSEEFRKAYKVLIYIDAKFDSNNQFKPKSIKNISNYFEENEFLFQPFQSFRIDSMQEGFQEGTELEMRLTYLL